MGEKNEEFKFEDDSDEETIKEEKNAFESLNSSLTIRNDASKCKIEEIAMGSDGAVEYYEMQLINF